MALSPVTSPTTTSAIAGLLGDAFAKIDPVVGNGVSPTYVPPLNALIGASAAPPAPDPATVAANNDAVAAHAAALAGLQENFALIADPVSHLATHDSLVKAANGTLTGPDGKPVDNPALAKAAQYFIDHPDEFTSMETAQGRTRGIATYTTPDQVFGERDIVFEKIRLSNVAVPVPAAPDDPHKLALDGLSDNYSLLAGDNGFISKATLEDAAKGILPPGHAGTVTPYQMATIKKSAQYFLDHPDEFLSLETARGTNMLPKDSNSESAMGQAAADGFVSSSDLAVESNRQPLTEAQGKSMRTLFDLLPAYLQTGATPVSSTDVSSYALNQQQLRGIADDPNAPQPLRDAARAVVDDPSLMRRLDTAEADINHLDNNGKADGTFSALDLMVLLNRPELNPTK